MTRDELRVITEQAKQRKAAELEVERQAALKIATDEVATAMPYIDKCLIVAAEKGETKTSIHLSSLKISDKVNFLSVLRAQTNITINYDSNYLVFDWSE